MSTEKLEYDAALGGQTTLPTHISTYRYAAGALDEIKNLISNAQQPTCSKLIFQTLPKHMRRRAMSHHPKRLPRKYRFAHKCQMKKSGGNQTGSSKRPSRKYRRRPKNLLTQYVRRQRHHAWLETHIWHAKRFHMVNRWGYRLPYASCNKTYRACYRASADHCLLQDISYYCCVQLEGNLEFIRSAFARLTAPNCGPSITAKTYLSGRREGSVDLFRDGQYPYGALQRISFMWQPLENTVDQQQRTLWLWLHPSTDQAVIEQLQLVFELKASRQQKLPLVEDAKQPALRFWTRTTAFERHKNYSNAAGNLKLIVLKQAFNRFRLTGPRAQQLLAASLRAYQFPSDENRKHDHWLVQSKKEQQLVHQSQADYCEKALKLSSPSQLLSNMIIGLNIVDPRLQKPQKRSKAPNQEENPDISQLIHAPECLPHSGLWQSKLRERLSKDMLSTHAYNQLRQQHAIVPGTACGFEHAMQPLPVLLVQRPGSQSPNYKRLAYGCGWDIIAPARYGMPLWLTLIMWGARPGGLREFDNIARETSTEHHLPDTLSGLEQSASAAAERRARYFRLPPNKRCNYRKFSVVSPFSAPLTQLVRDWQSEGMTTAGKFYVLREYQLLQKLAQCRNYAKDLPDVEQLPANALVQVQLRMLTRGNLHENALICLPTSADLKRRRKQMKHQERGPIYTEPAVPDLNEQTRRVLRLAHKRLLKRLRARRVRIKRKLQETSTRRVHIRAANTSQLVQSHLEEMCRLWLPTEPAATMQSVRRQGTREVFGYVTSASFSFTEAQVCAMGYVTVAGLRQLQQTDMNLCLVRDTDSRDYRFASFKINEHAGLA